ncbi:hypothetical protein [uncultured Hymenobacter sp.]|uniref:hypothetical protein n=1 Tax=uncultured Hymenobacter sp. TaxID=170016 RepID=UPI0035CC5BA5
MQPHSDTPARKGPRILLMVLLAIGAFFAMPPLVRWWNPAAGAFDVGTLNAPVLAALQFFAAVSMAFVAWRFLFPVLYAYVRESMEEKLFEKLTADLISQLPSAELANANSIFHAAERRRIAQFQFLIRCVRFLFSLLPFFVFLVLATRMVNSALTIVPH